MNQKHILHIKSALCAVFLIIIDQLTKYLASIYLKGNSDIIIFKNVLRLHYLVGGNTGAAWGLFSGQITMLVIFTIIAIIFISIFLINTHRILCDNYSLNNLALKIFNYALTMLLAGAVGNLIDRLVHGYVIDFIYFELINFPVFNVADCYGTISCVCIILIGIFKLSDKDFMDICSIKGFIKHISKEKDGQ